MRRWRRGERIVSGLHRTDGSNILPGMKRSAWHLLAVASLVLAGGVRAETETIDLKALAKKARPAVMLLVVSDAAGKEIATGTGFLVSSDGKLITNHHVIENAASAVAKAENGGLFPVEGVLAADPKNDLVLLKIKGKDLPFLPLGNSEKIEVGTRIAVIGSPLGLEGTLSEGIISAVREPSVNVKLLQVTAAISPGSSGSPVLSADGKVRRRRLGAVARRAIIEFCHSSRVCITLGGKDCSLHNSSASQTFRCLIREIYRYRSRFSRRISCR
jgi:S1-C subfamily serine protease